MKIILSNLAKILRKITIIEGDINIDDKYFFVFSFRQVRSRWSKARAANAWYKYILYSTKLETIALLVLLHFHTALPKRLILTTASKPDGN